MIEFILNKNIFSKKTYAHYAGNNLKINLRAFKRLDGYSVATYFYADGIEKNKEEFLQINHNEYGFISKVDII